MRQTPVLSRENAGYAEVRELSKTMLITELTSLIKALRQLPASMEKAENKRLENSFRKSLNEYFNGLLKAFPFNRLELLYKQNVREVIAPPPPAIPGDWDWLDVVIKSFESDLLHRVSRSLAMIYFSGSAQMISYGKTALGMPNWYEGPPVRAAVEWAENYCAGLVTKMDIETKSRLAKVISDGINNKRGIDGLARDIRKEFTDMSRDRAEMIARTETNQALSKASLDRMKDMGIEGKEWVVIGDDRLCEICEGNEAQGVIPVNQPFQSGHMNPPGHPNCRCALAGARLDSI